MQSIHWAFSAHFGKIPYTFWKILRRENAKLGNFTFKRKSCLVSCEIGNDLILVYFPFKRLKMAEISILGV